MVPATRLRQFEILEGWRICPPSRVRDFSLFRCGGFAPPSSFSASSARFDLWGSARSDFLSVARETTLGGDQFSEVTGGVADWPAPGSLEVVDVVDVSVGGHAEKDEVVQDRVRADKQVTGEALIFLLFGSAGVHRESSVAFHDGFRFFADRWRNSLIRQAKKVGELFRRIIFARSPARLNRVRCVLFYCVARPLPRHPLAEALAQRGFELFA